MIRPLTCLCLIAALGSGLYLYSEKHRTAMLDREIGRVARTTQTARERTGLLRAEWALLNEPGRLQAMAERYLALKTMAPTQFVQLAELAARLPAPLAAPAAGSTDDADAPEIVPAATPQAAAPVAALAAPAGADPVLAGVTKPAQAAVEAAAVAGQRPQPGKPVAKLALRSEPRPHAPRHVALADRQDILMQRGTPLPLATPQPMGATVFSAMARPLGAQGAHPGPVTARAAYASATPLAAPRYAAPSPIVGSALGGRGSLPPPVPYAGVR